MAAYGLPLTLMRTHPDRPAAGIIKGHVSSWIARRRAQGYREPRLATVKADMKAAFE